jgi:hypothetical protein
MVNKVPYIVAVTVILSVVAFTFYTANKRIQNSGADLLSSIEKKQQQYSCFKHPYYGNIFYFRPTISDSQFVYLTGFSAYQGVRDGFLYGHLDKFKKVFSFSVVYNNNATNLILFSENMMGYTTSGYFHNNETRGNPEFVRFEYVSCPYLAPEPKKVDQSNAISFTSKIKDDAVELSTQCVKSLRHEDLFHFSSFQFRDIFVLKGNGTYRGIPNSIVHGIHIPSSQIYLFQINYPISGIQRIFYFYMMGAAGIDYGVIPFFEDRYFEQPIMTRFLPC